MKGRLMALLVALALAGVGMPTAGSGRNADRPTVDLVLSVLGHVAYWDAEPLPRVRIELWNHGRDDFATEECLCNLGNAPTRVQLEIRDSSGRVHTEPEAWTYAYHSMWTRIAPMHYYGIETWLDVKTFPILAKPGTYTLTARYISKGWAAVPGQGIPAGWAGELVSNSVQIEILANH